MTPEVMVLEAAVEMEILTWHNSSLNQDNNNINNLQDSNIIIQNLLEEEGMAI